MLISLSSLLACYIASNQRVMALTYAGHDDRLFLNIAKNITEGHWLGAYNNLTLSKGPVYSFFIAINYYLGFPLLLSQRLLWVFSGLLLVNSLYKSKILVNPLFLSILYLIYVFEPISYSITGIRREAIYTSLSIIVIALMIDVVSNRQSIQSRFILSITLGLSLFCFWLTREEGIWIVPSLIILYILSFVGCKNSYKVHIKFFISYILPSLVFFILLINILSMTNYLVYGSYVINDMKTSEFKGLYRTLMSIEVDEDEKNPLVPISEEARSMAYSFSPTFSQLKPYLDPDSKNTGWYNESCKVYESVCGDIAGGWFVWALKDAVRDAGYSTSRKASEFYQNSYQELSLACHSRQISCTSQFLPPPLGSFDRNSLRSLFSSFSKGLMGLVKLPLYDFLDMYSVGKKSDLAFFEKMTNSHVLPLEDSKKIIHGWSYNKVDNTPVYFTDKNNVFLTVQRVPSPDIKEVTGSKYKALLGLRGIMYNAIRL